MLRLLFYVYFDVPSGECVRKFIQVLPLKPTKRDMPVECPCTQTSPADTLQHAEAADRLRYANLVPSEK